MTNEARCRSCTPNQKCRSCRRRVVGGMTAADLNEVNNATGAVLHHVVEAAASSSSSACDTSSGSSYSSDGGSSGCGGSE